MDITSRIQIKVPIRRVIEFSWSMDLHVYSCRESGETIIARRANGSIDSGESVILKGRLWGFAQVFTAKITDMHAPMRFVDEIVAVSLTAFRHLHAFTEEGPHTVMVDHLSYRCPFGIFGAAFDRFLLHAYLSQIIASRGQEIKTSAKAPIGKPSWSASLRAFPRSRFRTLSAASSQTETCLQTLF